MLVPEQDKSIKSFKIPALFLKSAAFVLALVLIGFGIAMYDYWKLSQQVYENRHLTLENRQLKEQIQNFKIKLNSLSDDLSRIYTLEKKLRVITGLENVSDAKQIVPNDTTSQKAKKKTLNEQFTFSDADLETNSDYVTLTELYEKKIASSLGFFNNYKFTKNISSLVNKSILLAKDFAAFDIHFDQTQKHVDKMEIQLNKLDQYLLDKRSLLRSTPSIIPTKGWITSYYGLRISPYHKRLKMHEGLDVGATKGTPILAPADGVITFSGKKSGFGKFVKIDHGYGMETIYAHSSQLLVKRGEKVVRGDMIAKVGNTGHSTGPHLHYEVRVNGIAVDPLYFILD